MCLRSSETLNFFPQIPQGINLCGRPPLFFVSIEPPYFEPLAPLPRPAKPCLAEPRRARPSPAKIKPL
jgi:hypothetical protein